MKIFTRKSKKTFASLSPQPQKMSIFPTSLPSSTNTKGTTILKMKKHHLILSSNILSQPGALARTGRTGMLGLIPGQSLKTKELREKIRPSKSLTLSRVECP